MADAQTRLQSLLDKMAKLEEEKKSLLAEAEAETAINKIGADLAGYITKSATTHKVEVKVLNGKFFALTVGEDGTLSVALTTKASKPKANGNGGTATNGNGGDYEYFLKDGRGPFDSIQKAMDEMKVPAEQRPAHNRYDRLSASWKEKIDRRPKATQPATQPEAEAKPEAEAEATKPEAEAEATS
jgi:hypothetical protein